MSLFESSRFIPLIVADLSPVASDVINHFQAQGYEIVGDKLLTGAWHISLRKGGGFKAVLGMKTALNIDIKPSSTGTIVTAGVGIFGAQAIPTVISMFIFWPVLIPQIWTIIQQSKIDDEAITVIEQRLAAHGGNTAGVAAASASKADQFCVACGKSLPIDAKFCPHCGTAMG